MPSVLFGLVIVRTVRREERHDQAERPGLVFLDEIESAVPDEIGLVTGVLDAFPVDEELRILVGAAAARGRVPVVETRLGLLVMAQVPLADEAAAVAVGLEHVGEGSLALQEAGAARSEAVVG